MTEEAQILGPAEGPAEVCAGRSAALAAAQCAAGRVLSMRENQWDRPLLLEEECSASQQRSGRLSEHVGVRRSSWALAQPLRILQRGLLKGDAVVLEGDSKMQEESLK